MNDQAILFKTEYDRSGWVDPWGITHEAYLIHDTVPILKTDETVSRHDGYGERQDSVWVADDGRRFQKKVDHITGMGSTWAEIGVSTPYRWEEPRRRRRYLMARMRFVLTYDGLRQTYPHHVPE